MKRLIAVLISTILMLTLFTGCETPRQKRERREYNQYLIDQAEEAKQKADENAKKIQDVDRAIADYKNALGK